VIATLLKQAALDKDDERTLDLIDIFILTLADLVREDAPLVLLSEQMSSNLGYLLVDLYRRGPTLPVQEAAGSVICRLH
jgi:hypothetical protein